MYYNNQLIQDVFNAGESMSFTFFYGHRPSTSGKITKTCLSQWWMQPFVIDGVTYSCAEQWMMASKARLFKDQVIEKLIMEATYPGKMKKLGRAVRNFKPEVWDKACLEIVKQGNLAKFGQNEDLKSFLLNTGDDVLVEASPTDDIWGVKLGVTDPRLRNPNKWQGTNYLGYVLMEVRDILRKEGE